MEPQKILKRVNLDILKEELIDLIVNIWEQLPPKKQIQFEQRIRNFGINMIKSIAKDAKDASNGEWGQIKQIVQRKLDYATILSRRQDLKYPSSDKDLEASIWWAVENGEKEDLELLSKVKKASPSPSEEINKLLEFAEKQISERIQKEFQDEPKERGEIPPQEKIPKQVEQYTTVRLMQDLNQLSGSLKQLKKRLESKWSVFTNYIQKAHQEAESKSIESVLQTLNHLFDELKTLPNFRIDTQEVRPGGGLLSAYEQTPVMMNESLVRHPDVQDRIDLEYLTEVLSTLVNEIRTIDEAVSG